MAKKTITTEITVCDFKHDGDVTAIYKVQPSDKDACEMHAKSFKTEVRLPDEFGGAMSGYSVILDPKFEAQMKVKYNKKENK